MQILLPLTATLLGWLLAKLTIRWFVTPQKLSRVLLTSNIESLIREILPSDQIHSQLSNPENFQKIRPFIEEHIDSFLKVKLAEKMPMISMFIGDNTIRQLKGIFMEELESLFPQVMTQYGSSLSEGNDPASFISSKLKEFKPDKVATALQPLLQPLSRKFEIWGALLGFLIGIVQLIIAAVTT